MILMDEEVCGSDRTDELGNLVGDDRRRLCPPQIPRKCGTTPQIVTLAPCALLDSTMPKRRRRRRHRRRGDRPPKPREVLSREGAGREKVLVPHPVAVLGRGRDGGPDSVRGRRSRTAEVRRGHYLKGGGMPRTTASDGENLERGEAPKPFQRVSSVDEDAGIREGLADPWPSPRQGPWIVPQPQIAAFRQRLPRRVWIGRRPGEGRPPACAPMQAIPSGTFASWHLLVTQPNGMLRLAHTCIRSCFEPWPPR